MSDFSSNLAEFSAILCYFAVLLGVAFLSYRKQTSDTDFIIGNRSLNYWLTALAAHASDMSNWLFMAYPASIFLMGMKGAWVGIGVLLFMFLNWQIVAPRIRIATEEYNSLTFSSFFESRLADTSGRIRLFTACMLFLFYTVYISAALIGMGVLFGTLFGVNYYAGVLLGTLIVVPYVFVGGYLTLAWIDLFQGLFLMAMILLVPLYLLPKVGGFQAISQAATLNNLSLSLFPDFSGKTLWQAFFLVTGWGLGYFGQPHIITKFMGIKRVSEMSKSKYIGMTWMLLALGAATLVGLVGLAYFKDGLGEPEQVFVEMVKLSFHPFMVGLILCAVLAATINAMSSMVLVLSSSLAEDFYKRFFRRKAPPGELLLVSRLAVIFVAIVAFIIAFFKVSTIYQLMLYAWSGLGASFGPLVILCLYSKKVNKHGAWAGILAGGLTVAFWPLIQRSSVLLEEVTPLVPAFILSIACIYFVSQMTEPKRTRRGG